MNIHIRESLLMTLLSDRVLWVTIAPASSGTDNPFKNASVLSTAYIAWAYQTLLTLLFLGQTAINAPALFLSPKAASKSAFAKSD